MSEERIFGMGVLIFATILTPMMILWCIPWYELARTPRDFWFNVSSDFGIGFLIATIWGMGIYLIWGRK